MSGADEKGEPRPCPLCKNKGGVKVESEKGDEPLWRVRCERCGEFVITWQCTMALGSVPDTALSGMARLSSEKGDCLRLTDANIGDIRKLAPTTVPDKARHLLRALVRKAQSPGKGVSLVHDRDLPLAFAKDADEHHFFLEDLSQRGWIKLEEYSAGADCTPTRQGWIEVENERAANIESDKAFVAMWFDSTMSEAYEHGIRPAIEEDAGYRSIRVDAVEHTGKIDDRIIAEIRESRFLVADFTGHRGGVYFEAGYAMGMGLPVIWTCKESDIGHLHFDTRQYNHIVWKTSDDLRKNLTSRIRATIGKNPNRRP